MPPISSIFTPQLHSPFLRRLPCLGLSTTTTTAISAAAHPTLPTQKRLRFATPAMDKCVLVLCGKSEEEKRFAASLKEKKVLKLRDKESGEEIETAVHLDGEEEEKNLVGLESFGVQEYMNGLGTRRFGRFLVWTPVITSTHDLLQQNFGEVPVGTVCLADTQSKGRGRVTNVWESPSGCLMYSFTVQMSNGRVLPLLQYVVSLAVTEAIKDVCKKRALPHLDVKIKWPNDIYLNGLKVAGISCNSAYNSGSFNISVGVGLNLDNQKPTICLNALLEEFTSRRHLLKREEILASFFCKFEDLFETFLTQGFEALEDLYYKTWLHSGQRVKIEEKKEGQSSLETCVTIQGLTSSGYLLAKDEDNSSYELHPDGNRDSSTLQSMLKKISASNFYKRTPVVRDTLLVMVALWGGSTNRIELYIVMAFLLGLQVATICFNMTMIMVYDENRLLKNKPVTCKHED